MAGSGGGRGGRKGGIAGAAGCQRRVAARRPNSSKSKLWKQLLFRDSRSMRVSPRRTGVCAFVYACVCVCVYLCVTFQSLFLLCSCLVCVCARAHVRMRACVYVEGRAIVSGRRYLRFVQLVTAAASQPIVWLCRQGVWEGRCFFWGGGYPKYVSPDHVQCSAPPHGPSSAAPSIPLNIYGGSGKLGQTLFVHVSKKNRWSSKFCQIYV